MRGEPAGAGPGQPLGDDQPTARLQNPVEFTQACAMSAPSWAELIARHP
jgi:hypothetical protein